MPSPAQRILGEPHRVGALVVDELGEQPLVHVRLREHGAGEHVEETEHASLRRRFGIGQRICSAERVMQAGGRFERHDQFGGARQEASDLARRRKRARCHTPRANLRPRAGRPNLQQTVPRIVDERELDEDAHLTRKRTDRRRDGAASDRTTFDHIGHETAALGAVERADAHARVHLRTHQHTEAPRFAAVTQQRLGAGGQLVEPFQGNDEPAQHPRVGRMQVRRVARRRIRHRELGRRKQSRVIH
jgi:hypothetical protein